MNIINSGTSYEFYKDSINLLQILPVKTYVVKFDKSRGFYLERHDDLEVNESRIYGGIEDKVEKVLSSFSKFNRNLGVLLSGDKGTGKSLFSRILCSRCLNNSIPVIIVSEYIPGVGQFLDSIDQEVAVIFDEFDKTFVRALSDTDPQTELLPIFDGMSSGKKLFVAICNRFQILSDNILNRPGRFHYHFRFTYPSSDEVRKYLSDKLHIEYYDQIEDVVELCSRTNVTYDSLRSIVFEINNGLSFHDCINDLNILNYGDSSKYLVELHYRNGIVAKSVTSDSPINSCNKFSIWLQDYRGDDWVRLVADTSFATYDTSLNCFILNPEHIIDLYYDDDGDDELSRLIDSAKQSQIKHVLIKRYNFTDTYDFKF